MQKKIKEELGKKKKKLKNIKLTPLRQQREMENLNGMRKSVKFFCCCKDLSIKIRKTEITPLVPEKEMEKKTIQILEKVTDKNLLLFNSFRHLRGFFTNPGSNGEIFN